MQLLSQFLISSFQASEIVTLLTLLQILINLAKVKWLCMFMHIFTPDFRAFNKRWKLLRDKSINFAHACRRKNKQKQTKLFSWLFETGQYWVMNVSELSKQPLLMRTQNCNLACFKKQCFKIQVVFCCYDYDFLCYNQKSMIT